MKQIQISLGKGSHIYLHMDIKGAGKYEKTISSRHSGAVWASGERELLHAWIYVDGWWSIQLTCVCPILLINRRTIFFQNFVTGTCAVVYTRTFWNYSSEHPDRIALAFETSKKIKLEPWEVKAYSILISWFLSF